MKLHLPVSLFKCLMSLMPVVAVVTSMPVSAEVMHRDITLLTYTDFGQNTGRYVTEASANSLLQYIRQQEGGVVITYTGGQADYTLAHGMIDFGSAYHVATAAAISPAAIATAAHHELNFTSTFTNKVYGIGNDNAIKYKAIEYVKSSAFSHQETVGSGNLSDHKVVRLSKIITDVSPASIYNAASDGLNNLTYYHVGSGRQWIAPYTNNLGAMNSSSEQLISGYNYVTAGITTTNWTYENGGSDHKTMISQVSFNPDGINASNPLTWVSKPGDSGSPLYVWDESKQCYSYVGSNFGEVTSGTIGSVFVLDPTFDQETVDSFTKVVNMVSDVSTIYLNAVNSKTGELSDGSRTGEVWSGTVTDGTNTLVSFNGLKNGLNTWGNLSSLKDTQNWYTYNESYVIQNTETLFPTENLQFNAQSAQNTIILNDSVDLGIGYAEFNAGSYIITSADGESNLFNHAGYVVNAGAEVHVQLTNPEDYMREWRKIGEGNLYIEGAGNNHILLNVGGAGKTYLNREGGYAAYNVLVNNGATVVIRDTNQIKRDLTFGNRGGTLDMNGNSMVWYTTAEAANTSRSGFSINALTEDAIIANTSAGTESVLTYKEGGETTFLGSFVDSANSCLKVVYDANGTWVLNSVRTNLQHADSGLQVNQGTVVLSGTNTVHGTGSDTGRNENRYFNENDWHYADATMNVTVHNSATFELGSHARLTGNVTVEQGGTYVMREGVRHQMEYVEGGQRLEDTGIYSDYFGHKGNVQLNGGTFAVQFNDGVDANTSYAGNVTGTGTMTVDAGVLGASFTFSGAVDSGISKILNRGQLILEGAAAADTDNKWLVNAGGAMVQLENAQDTLLVIDSASKGTLALTQDCNTLLDMSSHAGLKLGALSGSTVQYGAAGTTEALRSLRFGGDGKMVVNYVLSGSDTLNVDAGGMSGGEIHLTNVAQNYSGTVNVQATNGSIALTTAADGALNGATVNLNGGGTWQLADNQHSVGSTVNVNAGGTLQGKDVVLTGTVNLAGTIDCDSLTVQNGGRLVMQNGGTFDADNAVTIANGGTMDLNGTTFTQNVLATQGGEVNARNVGIAAAAKVEIAGGTLYAQGASLASGSLIRLANGGTMYGNGVTYNEGSTITATHGTGILDVGASADISGLVGADAGATLSLKGTAVTLRASNINTQGGTLDIQSSSLSLANFNRIDGTLSFGADTTVDVNLCGRNTSVQSHTINALEIRDNHSVTIHQTESTIAHVWNIGSLSGSGELMWKVQPYHHNYGCSRMILSGPGEFAGTIRVVQDYPSSGWYWSIAPLRLAQLELAHDDAAQEAVISLESASWVTNGDRLAQQRSGLAINTANAHIAGLNGTQYSEVFAGAAITAHSSSISSTARNTLTITGSGEYQYAGQIHGNAEYGLSIVMEGTGKQTFTSAWNTVQDVSVLRGALVFTNAPTIHGDVSMAQGAELTIGSGAFSLNAGHTLNVLSGNDGGQAVLNNNLVLNGGSLQFGAYDSTTAVLSTQGVSLGDDFTSLNVSFGNTMAIREGVSYLLASGDWSALAGKLTCDAEDGYLTAILGATSSGLQVTFALADGYSVWRDNESTLQAGSKVIFGTLNGSNNVELSASANIDTAYFDNLSDVTISSANGSSLSANLIEKRGIGSLVVNNTVNADTLRVVDSGLLAGSGRLSVDSIEISKGAQAHINNLTVDVESALTGDGVLCMGSGSFLQVGSSVSGNVQLADGSTLVAADSSVSTNLTLGESGADSRVSLRMGNSSGVALNGSIAVQGNTTLSVQGRGALQFNSAFNKLTALELQTGVNLSLSSEISTHLVLDGGTASLSGNNNKILDGDVTVKNGGTLTFTGTGSDIIDYNKSGKTLTVAGGTIDFGSTRQTMGGWTLLLSDGAVLTGQGNATHGAMDFNINNSTIYATSGSSSISAVTRLRNGNNLNYEVSDDATLTISGRHHSSGSNTMGSITKQGGGVLVLTGDALSLLTTASYIAVGEGTLDLSAAGSSANLSRVSGAGTVVLNYDMSGNGSGFDFSGLTGEVELRKGRIELNASTFGADCPDFRLTSSNSQLVFNGNGTVVNSNVYVEANSTDFHVNSNKSGTIGGDITGNSLVKRGGGSLTVGGNMKLNGMLSTHAGVVILTGEDNSIATVDGAMDNGNTAVGTLRLAQDARLEVTGNIWGRSNTGIYLESGAELNISGQRVSISNRAEEGTASLAATTSTGPGEYNITRTNYQISNAHVTYTGGNATINNLLTNSSIENAGSGILKVNNAENSLSSVHATGGSIKLFSADELDLKALEVATSLSVSAYDDVRELSNEEARISVTEIATFGTGVTLNADLVMKAGSSLNMAGAVQMGSDVRLETGLSLTGSLYDEVKSMKAGESVTLFTGVDALYLGSSQNAITSITLEDSVLAKDYFTNLSDNYFLIYDTSLGDGLGELSIGMAVPEPTTATLSLVALAALAMRRRRK